MNLCTNASHAMREKGGVLEISLKDVDLDGPTAAAIDPALQSGPYLELCVSDTGYGMDESGMERIFHPFFTTKPRGEGIGMGLAVVHGIVRAHSGAITVESQPGQGSVFRVYLPRIEIRPTLQTEASGLGPTGKERILLVDDERAMVETVRKMLERLGYHVDSTTSGLEALEIFRATPRGFDVIITDQTMPNMTGGELAGELLRIRDDLPIILCTGFSEVISEEKAKAIGIKAYVMKPIVTAELARTIRQVLDR